MEKIILQELLKLDIGQSADIDQVVTASKRIADAIRNAGGRME